MSSDQLSRLRSPHSRGDAKLVSYDEYIDTQVESTRRLVKVVDWATSLVLLTAGVLAFLLAVAVVEHWLVPGGFPIAVRALLFALLVCGISYFAYRRLWPLAIRTINPVYAAQAIEVAAATGPSLKNSLINLLLFRQRRSEISDAVYQTLEEQAAHRLSRVPVDAAVDRSLLIRLGYVLLAVVAVASLYKMFSPKDPLIAAQRVLMPWADIVPASRVSILRVEPGSVTVSRGEFIDVSAEVRGIGENDPVLLRFTTADGRAVDKPVPMMLSKDGLRFERRLPEGDDGSAGNLGLAQNLRYRIEAGDARTLDYDVTVVAAPSILVERVEYDYPDYTQYVNRHVEGMGDIRAIEGTRITIHARANGIIQQAHIDFDADGRRDLDMTATDTRGRASFVLRLREDRLTPEHASYVLRFTNGDGHTNRDPVKYAIHVEPDIAPEASILLPQEQELQVRLDETVAIEVEARDPDFALAEVRLRGEVAGRDVLNQPLLDGQQRRFTGRFRFTPSAHDLRAGDVLQYWATANDNRTPQPNTATSERKTLRIVSPDPAEQPPPDRLAQRDPPPRDQQPPQAGGDRQQQDGQPQGGKQQDREPGEQQPGAAGGEGQQSDHQQRQNGQGRGQDSREEPFGRDEQRSAEEGQGEKETGSQEEGAGGETQSGDRKDGQQDQQAKPGEQGTNDKQTGAGAAGGEPSGAQPAGTRHTDQPGAGSTRLDRGSDERADGGQSGKGDRNVEPSVEPGPVSSDGDNDAEAFERIRRHLERGGELPEGESNAADDAGSDAEGSDGKRQREKIGRQAEEDTGGEDARDERAQASERAEDQSDRHQETQGEELQPAEKQPGGPQDANTAPAARKDSHDAPSGAGEEQQPHAAPDPQPGMKPGERRQASPPPREQSDNTEPPAGGRGKKESDSQGEQGGDRAGGGEQGGGQDAPREGTGSAGQNQAADDGAGTSTEPGAGTDSPSPGKDATAGDRTGESSQGTAGRGSEQSDTAGQKPGGEAGKSDAERSTGGEQGDKETTKQGPGETGGEDAPARSPQDSRDNANQPGTATGGGGEIGTDGEPSRVEGTVPAGDEANLEYARKQTDLVLEELAEQLSRKRVDEGLLEELGWSEEDLRRFVARWQSRKEAAQRSDPSGKAAQRELDEALRSLGLRRGPLQQGPLKEDALRDLREGYRGAVPLEYQERLRAYNEGVSRARRDEVE